MAVVVVVTAGEEALSERRLSQRQAERVQGAGVKNFAAFSHHLAAVATTQLLVHAVGGNATLLGRLLTRLLFRQVFLKVLEILLSPLVFRILKPTRADVPLERCGS